MLQCSFLFIVKQIIIFMTSCKLVIDNYKGLYNANIWMSTALWGISGNVTTHGGRKSVTGATTKRRWNDGGSSTVSGVTTHRGRRSLTGVMEDSHWSGA